MNMSKVIIAVVVCTVCFCRAASARIVVVTYGDSQPGAVSLTKTEGLVVESHVIPIPVPMTAEQVRDQVLSLLQNMTTWAASPVGTGMLALSDLTIGTEIQAGTGSTGSLQRVATANSDTHQIAYPGHFQPFDPGGQPAIFNAGIVTDVGELMASVSAAELNFQTDGPIICQALFQRLIPQAPQYGATINYAGDRLEVYFDPAYTVTQGGIIFGTTSPSPQSSGDVTVPNVLDATGTVRLGYGDSLQFGDEDIGIEYGGLLDEYIIPMPAPMLATPRRDLVLQFLLSNSTQDVADVGPWWLRILGLADGTRVTTSFGSAAATDYISVVGGRNGKIDFPGFFDPFDATLQPAVFTAGILTDVGKLCEQVSASELSFQTDGPIICQALFQRLAPRAPQYGAQINYAGDRLEVYFDPAYTVTQGGIIFGTTSPTPQAGGSVQVPKPGDMNGDGKFDGLDIDPFLDALFNSAGQWGLMHPGGVYSNGDFDGDGVVTFLDLEPFVHGFLNE